MMCIKKPNATSTSKLVFSIFPCLSVFIGSFSLVIGKCVPGPERFCDQDLDKRSILINLPDISDETRDYYDIYYNATVPEGHCIMKHDRGIRIEFEKMAKISDVLIEINSAFGHFEDKFIVFLWRGKTSFECKLTVTDENLHQRRYKRYSCAKEKSKPFVAHALELTSTTQWSMCSKSWLNSRRHGSLILTHHRDVRNASLDIHRECLPPGIYPGQKMYPARTFFKIGEKVIILCDEEVSNAEEANTYYRTCTPASGKWSKIQPICRPIRKWYSVAAFEKSSIRIGQRNSNQVNISYVADFGKLASIVAIMVQFSKAPVLRDEAISKMFYYILESGTIIYERYIESELKNASGYMFNSSVSIDKPCYCVSCRIMVTFLGVRTEEALNVQKIEALAASNYSIGEKYRRYLQECPPLDPYPYMPESYKNYELVLNGTINGLLVNSPCRMGFKNVNASGKGLLQCVNGNWKGTGYPECEVILTKNPPRVSNATWNYVHDDVFNEITYTCDNGYELTSRGKVTYDETTESWIGVPECKKELEFLEKYWPFFVSGAILSIIVLVGVAAVMYRLKKAKKRKPKISNTGPQGKQFAEASAEYLTPSEILHRSMPRSLALSDVNDYEDISDYF